MKEFKGLVTEFVAAAVELRDLEIESLLSDRSSRKEARTGGETSFDPLTGDTAFSPPTQPASPTLLAKDATSWRIVAKAATDMFPELIAEGCYPITIIHLLKELRNLRQQQAADQKTKN